jgi:glycopeptide antibiotics resistance protein
LGARVLPSRRTYAWLAAGVMAFAIYASVLPFRFRWVPLDFAIDHFSTLMTSPQPGRTSRTNFLANVLLFVPIGFGLAGAFLLDRKRTLAAVCGTAGGTLALSLGVSLLAEFLQEFVPGRVPTRSDVEAQAAGWAIGFAAWMVGGQWVSGWLREAQRQRGTDRLSTALLAYAAVWGLVNLAPFDLTLDLGELAQRVRSGLITVVPFSGTARPGSDQAWDMLATTLSAVPLGALGVLAWPLNGRHRTGVQAFAVGALLVCGVEMAQVFILSHAADITDAMFGLLGVGIGIGSGRALWRSRGRSRLEPVASTRWPLAAVCGWCLVLMIYHWKPYDFHVSPAEIRDKLARLSLIPFVHYARGSDLNALNDLLVKLGLSVPLGVLMALVPRPSPPRLAGALWLAAAAGIFTIVEGGQLLLPTRSPDLSDILVGVIGTAAGLAVCAWVRRA